jgi:hypothetical protein
MSKTLEGKAAQLPTKTNGNAAFATSDCFTVFERNVPCRVEVPGPNASMAYIEK